MIRFLIAFSISLGLSLGISTGWVVVGGRNPAAASVDSLAMKTDSTGKAAEVDSVKDTLHVASTDSSPLAMEPSSHEAVTPAPVVGTASIPAVSPGGMQSRATDVPQRQADSGVVRRLASVFASMSARDAARVLTEMDNDDVQVILLSLPRKQQAAILSSLPANRAALITKATLRDTL